MRFNPLSTVRATMALAGALALVSPVAVGAAHAQTKAPAAAAPAEAPQPKQVSLDQKTIDGLIAAQREIRDIEAKMPTDAKAMDAKTEAQIDAAIKKNGFATTDAFANASYSVGVVLAGVDPDTGKYIGAEAATRKQIADVQADKEMPPKEKKEALDELNESLKLVTAEKPPQGNIDLVTANVSKLNEGLKQAD